MNRPLISVMSIVDLLQQDDLKGAARLMARLDQDQAVVIALELPDLVEAPVITALRKAVKEVLAAPQPEHSVAAALGDCGHAEVNFVRPTDSPSLFAGTQQLGRALRKPVSNIVDVREVVQVLTHDDGSIYQFGENVFVAWDESGAGIACADVTLEDCRRQLRAYAAAISGD